jgi:hypothetical protein
LAPKRIWDGNPDFEFEILGRSDSDYATNPDHRRSVSGARTFLEECPTVFRSATQKTVSLSVTESEGSAGVMTAQDMLYVCRLLKSVGLKVN